MRITESQLRRIIREERARLHEGSAIDLASIDRDYWASMRRFDTVMAGNGESIKSGLEEEVWPFWEESLRDNIYPEDLEDRVRDNIYPEDLEGRVESEVDEEIQAKVKMALRDFAEGINDLYLEVTEKLMNTDAYNPRATKAKPSASQGEL